MELKQINEQIDHISKVFSEIVLERSLLESKLFPVNAYICVGFYQTYHNLFSVMKEVWSRITPEEMAAKSKGLLSPMQGLSVSYQWLYYSLARMGEIHNKYGGDPAKEPREKQEEWKFILENWYRLATSYLSSGKPTIAASGYRNQALNESSIAWLKENLQPVTQDQVKAIRRTIGSIDLYAFIDECEARAKIINHGPYPAGNGEDIVVAEYTNMYDGRGRPWLPWSATESKLPSSSLGIAMSLKGVKTKFIDIGTMMTDPGDYSSLVTRAVAYTKVGGGIKAVGFDELPAYAEAADNAQGELYMKFAEMDRRQLLLAGATAYWRCFAR
ncbi:MAG TPA: hypothetical protein PKX17_02265, partial [Candidatus Methanomethylicus sp.]|nr:hypothetical protein [Candidatus Methanomethylicus sp.]